MKDEMQIGMIEKVLEPIVAQVDTSGECKLRKTDCEAMVKKCLEQLKVPEDVFNESAFTQMFNQFDTEKKGYLTKRQLAKLVNLMAFGGL